MVGELRFRDYVLISGLLLFFIFISIYSVSDKSLTTDEPPYIASAYTYFHTNDYTLNFEHPPLIKQLFAIPALVLEPNIPLENENLIMASSYYGYDSRTMYQYNYARELLFESGNDADLLIFSVRLINIILGAILGLIIFIFSFKLFGRFGAYISLIAYSLSPTIIANSRLAMLDIGNSLLIFLTVFVFYHFLAKPSFKKYVLFLFVFTLSLLSKHTSLLLIFLLPLIYLLLHLKGKTKKCDIWVKSLFKKNHHILFFLMFLLGSLLFIFFIIWLDYGFEIKNIDFGKHSFLEKYAPLGKKDSHISFPALSYFKGVKFQLARKAQPFVYLFGKSWVLEQPPRYLIFYYPIAFLTKTALPILFLLSISIYAIRKKTSYLIILLTPALFFFLYFSLFNKVYLGAKYLLPIYPFLFVLMGGSVSLIKKRTFRIILILLGIWLIIENSIIFPHYNSYFNQLCGGADKGHKCLTDFNVDMGQDLILLQRHISKENLTHILIAYHGEDSLEYRNLSQYYVKCDKDIFYTSNSTLFFKDLQQQNLFISLNLVHFVDNAKLGFSCWNYLKDIESSGKIGHSILYYNLSSYPELFDEIILKET